MCIGIDFVFSKTNQLTSEAEFFADVYIGCMFSKAKCNSNSKAQF
jgi:predicted adenine nucleotide alpha hydrolase (AANH) superfamily ATPase